MKVLVLGALAFAFKKIGVLLPRPEEAPNSGSIGGLAHSQHPQPRAPRWPAGVYGAGGCFPSRRDGAGGFTSLRLGRVRD